MKIYVTGHISPDLDSVASAYTYAEFLRKSKRYGEAEVIPVTAGEPNKETKEIFNKFEIYLPQLIDDYKVEETDGIVLVDHNEQEQRSPKVKAEQVLEILDHHKINVALSSPVRIDVKPFGCSNSLIYELFDMYGIEASDKTQKLMLAAILSDTQGLKSSTTTGYDSEVAHYLAQENKIDLEKLTFDIFKAKSDITGLTIEQICKKDFKIFKFGEHEVFINQIETVEPHKIVARKEDMVKQLESIKVSEGVGQAYLVVTDILKINSQIIYSTEEEAKIIERAFTTRDQGNISDIGPRMSRKKDIAPAIEKVLMQ